MGREEGKPRKIDGFQSADTLVTLLKALGTNRVSLTMIA